MSLLNPLRALVTVMRPFCCFGAGVDRRGRRLLVVDRVAMKIPGAVRSEHEAGSQLSECRYS